MSSNDPPMILKGTYTTISNANLPYAVYKTSDDLFTIQFDGKSDAIEKIFPGWRGEYFNVNKTDFENFKKNVVNNPL